MNLIQGSLRPVALSLLLLGAAGCATNDWQAEDIPYPRTTPFDASQFARAAFLDGFGRGYSSAKSGGGTTVEMLTGPFTHARRQGFFAGSAQARAEMEASPESKR